MQFIRFEDVSPEARAERQVDDQLDAILAVLEDLVSQLHQDTRPPFWDPGERQVLEELDAALTRGRQLRAWPVRSAISLAHFADRATQASGHAYAFLRRNGGPLADLPDTTSTTAAMSKGGEPHVR